VRGPEEFADLRPEVVEAAAKLNGGRSLRAIAAGLSKQRFLTKAGTSHTATSIRRMLGAQPSPDRRCEHCNASER
jgi:hypothetical protein